MKKKKNKNQFEIMEGYKFAFDNVKKNEQISVLISAFGYNEETMEEGLALWQLARDAFDKQYIEKDETVEAYQLFKQKKEEVNLQYSNHRKMAKSHFKTDEVIQEQLAIDTRLPTKYVDWVEKVVKFYQTAINNSAIQNGLATMGISIDILQLMLSDVESLSVLKADYVREKSESQEATASKVQALEDIDEWMSKFYVIAKVALKEHPQLLEALGKQE